VLDGGPGDDTMTGGPGSDLYYVDSIADRVIETDSSLGSGGTDSVYSRLPAYTLPANVENLRLLSTGAANAAGNGRSNILFAGAGDNVLDGGAGSDTLSYIYAQSGVTVSLADPTSQATGGSGSDRLIGIENLTGSAFNDSLTGNGVDNVLRGKGGNDRLAGGGGNDLLDGGAGVDTLLGGGGNDVFVVDSLGDVVWESQLPGGGIDTLQFEFGGASAVTVSLGGIASDLAAGKTYSNVENLTLGGAAAHNAVGSVANNQIVGNAAANKLFGQNGNDTLVGGAGADTLAGGDGNDRFVLSSATVADTVSDFTTAIDKMAISQAGIRVGDGNTLLTSSTLGGPGGFSNTIELVVVTGNIDGAITATSAAAKIGPAVAAYTVGRKALFAVDNGADSALYLFTAANADAGVSAGELKLLAMMTDTASTAVSDYLFVA
jgi:Ca2+-binding RTX toxin-like protein